MNDESNDRTNRLIANAAGSPAAKAEAAALSPADRAMLEWVLEHYPSLTIDEALAQLKSGAGI